MKKTILFLMGFAGLATSAMQIAVSDPRVEGDVMVVPCSVTDLSEPVTLTLQLGAAAPKEGEPTLNAVVATCEVDANGVCEFCTPVTLGTKIVCRVEASDGTVSSERRLTVPDSAAYTWKPNGDGLWSDPTMWTCSANDGLRRLGYPSYGSRFDIYGNQTDVIRVDAAYTDLQGNGTLGWGGANITFIGTVPGACIGTSGFKDGQYDDIQVTLDGVAFPDLGTWHVKNRSSLVMRNGASIVTRWEVWVEGTDASMFVGPDCRVAVSVAEPYHALRVKGQNARLVVEGGSIDAFKVERDGADSITLQDGATLTERRDVPLVNVSFDANGGVLEDVVRTVRYGERLAQNCNLYPSDLRDNFTSLNMMRLEDNTLNLSFAEGQTAGQWCNFWTKNSPYVKIDSRYTYVLEFLELEGTVGSLNIGRTGGYSQATQHIQLEGKGAGEVRAGVTPAVKTFVLRGLPQDPEGVDFNMLDRAYLNLAARGTSACRLKLRVSLFSGTSVTEENFSYVAPYRAVARALPVPTREGFVFEGWRTPDGRPVVDDTRVTWVTEQTLVAAWTDLGIAITGADRPRVGKPLTASSAYATLRDGANVSWKWFRRDVHGVLETTPIAEGDTYVPTTDDYEHGLRAVLYVDGTRLGAKEIWFSKLPVVYLDTDDGQSVTVKTDYKPGWIRIQGNETFKQQCDLKMEIKGRGNSSWGFPKKPYKLKLDKKTDLFGYGKNKHWVLIANFLDEALVRNKLAYDLARDLGQTAMGSEYVDVVFNGAYAGNYLLCEHIRVDANRVDVFDWEGYAEDNGGTAEDLAWIDPKTTDITGGYLWELSDEFDEVSKFMTEAGLKVMLNKPEFLSTNPAMMDWCSNFWETVTAGWKSPIGEAPNGQNYLDLVDVESMAAYLLVQDGFGNNDASYKSRYCYKDVGGKAKFGPVWDFDWGCGASVVNKDNHSAWILAKGWGEACFYSEWVDDPWFCLKMWELYTKHRTRIQSILTRIDAAHDYLRESGDADDRRWHAERTAWHAGRTSTKQGYEGDIQRFRTWMANRLAWFDAQFASLDTLVQSLCTGNSAERVEADDRLRITVDERGFHAVVTDARVAAVDVRVNGRIYLRNVPVVNQACSFRVDLPTLNVERGRFALVELIGRTSTGEFARKSGNLVLRNYIVLSPGAYWGTRILIR